jgi:XTP/dITP diphosphohydrolase
MKQSILFATQNPNKVREINQLLPSFLEVIPLQAAGITEELPETQHTLEGNALQKARYAAARWEGPVFAEDTGLEVDALGGEPGVFTARYAGPQRNAQDNMAKLLRELHAHRDRSAQFRTVIALIRGEREHLFEGVVRGRIAEAPSGSGGFGYDPLFIPEGHRETFAEMESQAKNAMSHRGRALRKLVEFLKNHH